MLGQPLHQVGGVDRLEETEGVEGVLLLESVGLSVSLAEPFADLDDLATRRAAGPAMAKSKLRGSVASNAVMRTCSWSTSAGSSPRAIRAVRRW